MKKIILSFFLLSFVTSSLLAQFEIKNFYNEWKLIKNEEDGKSIDPIHEQLVISLDKKKTFTITAAYEETHSGSWELSEDNKTITLIDSLRDYKQELTILDLDKTHFAVGNYDGKNNTVYFIPLGKAKHQKLNSVEHSLVKKWTCYDSDKDVNKGLMIEYKSDFTFIMIPYGAKIPMASGKWKLDDDRAKILMDKKDGGHLELIIVERHSHELHLMNEETEITNHFHDPKRTRTDMQEGVLIPNKNKPHHDELGAEEETEVPAEEN